MSMVAVCPNCHIENSPMNVACDVCKTALGALLVETVTTDTTKWLLTSASITFALYLPCWVLGLHSVTLLMAMFYGPLIASYNARSNVVWPAALGGLLAFVVVLLINIMMHWQIMKATFGGVLRSETKTSAVILLVFGVPLALLAVFPLNLVGASVGEHLSARRRRIKPAAAAPSVAPPARAMSDEEISKIEL